MMKHEDKGTSIIGNDKNMRGSKKDEHESEEDE